MKHFKINLIFLIAILVILDIEYSIANIDDDLSFLNKNLEEHTLNLKRARKAKDYALVKHLEKQLADLKFIGSQTVSKYRNVESDPIKHRQVELFMNIGSSLLSNSETIELETLIQQAKKVFDPAFEEFEYELLSGEIQSEQHALELRRKWETASEKITEPAKELMKSYFNLFFRAAQRLNLPNGMVLYQYIIGSNNHIESGEISKLWQTDVKFLYQRLLTNLKSDIAVHFYDTAVSTPMPAFIYDVIFNSYNFGVKEKYKNSTMYRKIQGRTKLVYKKFDLRNMTEKAQAFYESLGFHNLNHYFWTHSIFEDEPESGPVVEMHYFNAYEYSIEVRAEASAETFTALHTVLFKIHRYLQLDKMSYPYIFRSIDFRPFYDALEAAVVLSSNTIQRSIDEGFLDPNGSLKNLEKEWLKSEAIRTLTTSASSFAVDAWKWEVMAGFTNEDKMFCELWKKRNIIEGIDSENFQDKCIFDVYSKNHPFGNDISYRNFLFPILKYQIFIRLCFVGQKYNPQHPLKNPLHKCDITGSRIVGTVIKDLMRYGASKNWRELLNLLSGLPKSQISPKGMINYFAPFLYSEKEEDLIISTLTRIPSRNSRT